MKKKSISSVAAVGFIFILLCLTKTSAQKLEEDKCEAFVSKAEKSYKECFGANLIIEFTPKITDAFGITNLDDEWARLDTAAVSYRTFPEAHLFVVIYGGKINKKGEINERADRLVNYLTENRGIDSKKISIITGGFRDKFEFGLWMSPSEKIFPPLSPTVDVEKVKFKGKMKPSPRDLYN